MSTAQRQAMRRPRSRTTSRTTARVARSWQPLRAAGVQWFQQTAGNQATTRLLRAPLASSSVSAPPKPASNDRDLQSPRFAGDPALEGCLDGVRVLKLGDSGESVERIQLALVEAGFPLPQFGADGKFGGETRTALQAFQRESGLAGGEVDGVLGPTTMGLLDARFAGAPPPSPVPPSPVPVPPAPVQGCPTKPINTDRDPLPAVPPFSFTTMTATDIPAALRAVLLKSDPNPKNLPSLPVAPLGASLPHLPITPVSVKALAVSGSPCMKCVADWDAPAEWSSFVAVGSFTDEPKRFAPIQQGDVSGCPPNTLAPALDVRKLILPEAVAFIIAGEFEHYLDFVRAFRIVFGRYLGNVRRLTAERTHLLGKDQSECADKVGLFLTAAANLLPLLLEQFLTAYTQSAIFDFNPLFTSPDRDRPGGPHFASSDPLQKDRPIFPNIDLAKNPFGCTAFARRFNARSFPGIPGGASDTLVVDQNVPPKQPWHTM
jgi:peptidoglycan hydrolase-like protein with peptidoglycan-binding domain